MDQGVGWIDYAGLATSILSALGIFACAHDRWDRRVQAEIASPAFRARLIEIHDDTVIERYYAILRRLPGWADRVWGPRASWRSFNRCLLPAFVYPEFAAFIAWSVAGQTSFGGPKELWAWVAPGTVPLDWQGYRAASRADWTYVIALWAICATTLLPTATHLGWVALLWQVQKSDATITAVNELRHLNDTPDEATRMYLARLIRRGRIAGALRLACLPAAAALLFALAYASA